MKKANKQGFTLIEVVISVAIITLISVGFMQMTMGSTKILKAGEQHSEATAAMMTAIASGQLPQGYESRKIRELKINLSNDNGTGESPIADKSLSVTLNELKLSDSSQKTNGDLYYYQQP